METVAAQNDSKNLDDLETAIQNAVKQVLHCDEQIILWQNKKQAIQREINEKLGRLQKHVNDPIPKIVNDLLVTKVMLKTEKNSTIPELIHSFLEKNGPTRAKDIRKFLLAKGRKTNPGVALSRMVKTGGITNAERGLYRIA